MGASCPGWQAGLQIQPRGVRFPHEVPDFGGLPKARASPEGASFDFFRPHGDVRHLQPQLHRLALRQLLRAGLLRQRPGPGGGARPADSRSRPTTATSRSYTPSTGSSPRSPSPSCRGMPYGASCSTGAVRTTRRRIVPTRSSPWLRRGSRPASGVIRRGIDGPGRGSGLESESDPR